jgi:hypothetical protein
MGTYAERLPRDLGGGGDEARAALRASAQRIQRAGAELIGAANGEQENGAAA